ncbi:EAL domain-containing protein [Legionella waltersii]|uniref:Two component histidine kinase n=1 Tax=Legionella waltersii TaxID=66969 RepID=A0A0W1ANI3_9GAMM|nr:EAL domain-containing protein [Legionella waltersii]KTD82816.1 two component histidine kinase [Legionella waltersii]SNV01525.1 two component histidine kinase, GGDEF domain protein/EAL domain protein [Legionella waltersii]
MTLTKKLAVGVLIMLFLVFIGTYLITMNNARNFFIQQVESNAQDTATSLGLSLSQPLISHDLPTINSMVNAVFDRGYFSSIKLKNMKGKILVSKTQPSQHWDIPNWFVNLVSWPTSEKTSLVMDGWMQAGVVVVAGDPSYVYVSLWRNAVEMVNAYLLFAIISLALVVAFIQFILKPLKRVTNQALAISEHEFPIETHIPKTPELKQVTLAMNQMVSKIKSFFEDQAQQTEALRVQVYQDTLTGMNNRRYFLQQLTLLLEHEDEFVPGYVLMLVVDGLDELNHKEGYQQGDNLVLTVSKLFQEFWKQLSVSTLARINGSTFALISHETDPNKFEKECIEFEKSIKQAVSGVDLCAIYMGASSYFLHQSVSNLLTVVDQSVKKARENGVFYCHKEHETYKYSHTINQDDIRHALDRKKISLYSQEVTDGKQCLHHEVFVRIHDDELGEFGAGYFMPIAEKLGMASLIDLYVLKAISTLDKNLNTKYALNISENTLADKLNSTAYLQQLTKIPEGILKNLALELNELYVISHFSNVKQFIKQAKKLGVAIGIDRVGVQFSPLQYLSNLNIDYLKLHGSLVSDIEDNESKQFFIYYFNEMAQTMDVQVVATQVENKEQWSALQKAHIKWGQGRFLAKVELIKQAAD